MTVDVADTAVVKDVLTEACSSYGYKARGSKLVVKGEAPLKEDTVVSSVSDKVLTFVGVKAAYKSKQELTQDEKQEKASRASVSPARGAELDLSDAKHDGPFDLQHRQGIVQLRNALAKISEADVPDLLFIHPTVLYLRTLVQGDSTLLAPAMAQIHSIAPTITEMIHKHSEPFVALLNDPVNAGRYDDMQRGSEEDEEELDFVGSPALAGELTNDELEALARIQDLGPFPRELVFDAFMGAGRNEHLAASYLLEMATYEPLVFAQQQQAPPQESEADMLRGRLAAAEASGEPAAVLDAVASLGVHLAKQGDADCEALLLRAVRLALVQHAVGADASEAAFDASYDALTGYYHTTTSGEGSVKEVLLHEAAGLMALAKRGVNVKAVLEEEAGSDGAAREPLSIERLTAVAAKEGVDLVLVHHRGEQLVVWQIRHRIPEKAEEAVVRQRSVQLSAGDAELLSNATQELNACLTLAPQKGWGVLHQLHQVVFGCEGCGSWMPSKASFCSSMAVPLHALSPHGGVPLSRGRQITQNNSVLWLEAHQRLAVKQLTTRGRRRQLRSVYVGNAPGYVASKHVAVDALEEGESVTTVHFGANTTGGETQTTLATSADVAVFSCGVGDAAVGTYDPAREGVWACSSLVYLLDPTALTSPTTTPAVRPKRDQHLLLQAFHRALSTETKIHAYSLALGANPDTHIRAWVPWVLTGTRLLLGGRRAHIKSEKLKATDDYRYLEAHSMHIVFDKMIGHLLSSKPEDPVDSLLAYMETTQAELEAIGSPKDE
eukprot:TRINITY_DN1982_c1_g4_i1.p1 TRINITY_DN1982_c1_g4~~TRINITY_DN1982_c1_g4_i1.p1  ORF type:complete len:816 (+),score=298.53 TRINITY_DN1982_c1_g4_i1:112-2448(+)